MAASGADFVKLLFSHMCGCGYSTHRNLSQDDDYFVKYLIISSVVFGHGWRQANDRYDTEHSLKRSSGGHYRVGVSFF